MQFLSGLKTVFGLLSGTASDSYILPSNEFITNYNIKNGSLFKIKLEAYKVPDITITTSSSGIQVQPLPSPQPLGEFEIIYSADSLNISHSHNFDTGGGYIGEFAQSLSTKGIMGLDGTTASMAKGAFDLFKNIGSGQGGSTTFNTDWNTAGALDIAKAYKGSTAPPFSVTFTVMATNNPLSEVVAPAVLLTYLSYPRLSKQKSVTDFLNTLKTEGGSLLSKFADFAGVGSGSSASDAHAKQTQQAAQSAIKSASNFLSGVTDGKWRYRLGDTPPYWKISTSNGLFNLNNASLQSVNINYFGPWLEAPSKASILSALKSFSSNSKMGFDPSSIFPGTSPLGSSLDLILGSTTAKNGGFPSYATITLNFINNFNIVFGEEWLTALTGDNKVTTNIT